MTECKRCGRCCIKGGPVLHLEDRFLVVEGFLKPEDLITIRKGEPALDPRTNEIVVLERELIKIRGAGKIGACKFYEDSERRCTIYGHRPVECRLLKCWDTSDLEDILMKDLLARLDLMPEGSTVRRLVSTHDGLFDPGKVTALLGQSKEITDAFGSVEAMVVEEERFRRRVMAEFSLNEAQADFFFGRPLGEIAQALKDMLHEMGRGRAK